ncbi:NAD(P)/FAD-dependent oxidoreductase [Adhaeribacter sp. BT258]|uniref:NAD(P)/FAD-dependent oxidoreductase n=1 Tax=Adhaeribacter terrigena TaxID=2793070 RepID=A0ABS1C1S1_9BACT|nr:NAD(P)/FAD-dependent oxidoreductase [Adhaeribacter terrigena]MBK0403336.1 NAD(P)/FAD-dependent oxidoreductase [Adhaeribacter terrigena]
MEQVIVIGGGLAGLSSAMLLARAGIGVTLIEKKNYPFHRVCGEYISNEVLPFLETLGVDLNALNPARINHFQLTSPSGKMLQAPLDLGGFGISRFVLDHYLYQLALQLGVKFRLQTTAESVVFSGDKFTVTLSDGTVLQSEVVAGTFGKRSNLDRQLNRSFFTARSPFLAVKYHLKTDLPKNVIALHNFENGYAGISAIENDRYCFCYLTTRQNLKTHKTVAKMEEKVLCQNPHLQKIFRESKFLYAQPEVINEISFAPKTAVADHVLCAGDAAGLITPLCGNGMAMAFHAGKILAEEIAAYFQHRNRALLETRYTIAWQNQFSARLRVGRAVQQVFGKKILSEMAVSALQKMPFAVQFIMKNTHGKPF